MHVPDYSTDGGLAWASRPAACREFVKSLGVDAMPGVGHAFGGMGSITATSSVSAADEAMHKSCDVQRTLAP